MRGDGDTFTVPDETRVDRYIITWASPSGATNQLVMHVFSHGGDAEALRLTNAIVDGMRRARYDLTVHEERKAVRRW